MSAAYVIVVGGADITSLVSPYLIDLTVTDKAGTVSDRATLRLDDRNGRLAMPPKRAPVVIMIAGAMVFTGTVDDVRSSGSRGAGRVLIVEAKGMDTGGALKAPKERHWDDATAGEVMSEAASDAGLAGMRVHTDLAGIRRDYWAQDGESLIAFGRRLARELGATFKIVGTLGVMVPRGVGLSASGLPLVTVAAAAGVNLVSWDLSPLLGRPVFGSVAARWYDLAAARWKTETADTDAEAEAEQTVADLAADGDSASASARSESGESRRGTGGGQVVIDGNPAATPEGLCIVSGARAGVDGAWRIDGVTHEVTRGRGFLTTLDLAQPGG